MYRFGKFVVKFKWPVLAAALILMIPAVWGMNSTRINYDMLTYLPEHIDTVQGQHVLSDQFGKGAFSLLVVEDMPARDVARLRRQIEAVPHVDSAVWYDSFMDLQVPVDILPDDVKAAFIRENKTIMAIFFETTSSSDETIAAVGAIRAISGRQCFLSGISALVTDLRNLCEKEEPIYVGIAVLCALLAMFAFTDAWLVPILFLTGIGITILYNLGTNVLFGEISYITKALAAVLQLAVTMDYAIFLWHAYCDSRTNAPNKEEAMAHAIQDTVISVFSSSLTTIAGFLALCFMSYAMGMDLGLVMAKGCLLGVIGSVTILPALILVFDRPLSKTMHRPLLPDMSRLAGGITKHYAVFLVLFALILVPAVIGHRHTPVYYDFSQVMSGENTRHSDEGAFPFLAAKQKLEADFDVATTHMILCDAHLPDQSVSDLMKRIDALDGVKHTLSLRALTGSRMPSEMIPEKLAEMLRSGQDQLMLVSSSYAVSSDACNEQIDAINSILKQYDPSGMLIGEGPCTKDMIEITDRDFVVVSWVSVAFVFLIILLTFRSLSLPVILVAVIEFAVFINLGIPYYTGFTMPFIAPICISTIQLGSTVDYAILLTTRYRLLRKTADKRTSVTRALSYALPSVVTSALSFFAATFGVSLYSDIDLIRSMCRLLARGAIISMLSVLLVLPSLLMLLDGVIRGTSLGMNIRPNQTKQEVIR